MLLPALALLAVGGKALTRPDDLPRLAKRLRPAVVTVIAYNSRGQAISQGSGFFVTPTGQFLTNYHVLATCVRAEVKTAAGHRYAVKGVAAADRDWDLLVGAIDPPREGVHSLELTARMPEVGERIVVVGSPLGLEQTLSEGVVSAWRPASGGKMLQIAAPVSPGSSGSPVVNRQGEVVGVATLQVIKGQNLNFAVPGGRALALKQQAAGSRVAPTPLLALWPKSGAAKRHHRSLITEPAP